MLEIKEMERFTLRRVGIYFKYIFEIIYKNQLGANKWLVNNWMFL